MYRREVATLAGSALAGAALPATSHATEAPDSRGIEAALRDFRALAGTKSYRLHVGPNGSEGRYACEPTRLMFTASSFKTFVLAQYLRDVEAKRLSEDTPLAVDNRVRNLGSPVLIDLAGKTLARSILEAMIAHSDNTATDIALLEVGVDRVRALVARAGLTSTVFSRSTRVFTSYVFGAPLGVDIGWAGIERVLAGHPPGPPRSPFNSQDTLASTANDFVRWYEQALRGTFFEKADTLREYKRILATADGITATAPADTSAYGKGGEVGLDGFLAKALAGQMVVGTTPVTFCFVVNKPGPGRDFPEFESAVLGSIAAVLDQVKRSLG